MEMRSLWNGPVEPAPPEPLAERYDAVVVGGGLTGLTTSVLLARAGLAVAVLEARSVGTGTTGSSTAKVSLLQGTRLSAIDRRQPIGLMRRYVTANREGQAWLLHYCEQHDVPFQRRAAFTYATTERGVAAARAELASCQRAGLDATWDEDLELPFNHLGAVRLDEQAQLDPMQVLEAMAADLVNRGGVIHEGARVQGVSGTGPMRIRTTRGETRADTVVIATGIPILDRGLFFSRLEPRRSYLAAFRVPGSIPQGMYLSADEPTRSLRTAPSASGDLLLVGGNGHVVGRQKRTARLVDDLTAWTGEHFPGAERTHAWSAQDYHPVDELPYVGPLTPGYDHLLVATGYSKWGMTNAVAAALALSGRILGGHIEWAEAFRPWSGHELRGTGAAAAMNAGVGARWAGGRLGPLLASRSTDPEEGQGLVRRDGFGFEAVSRVGGTLQRRSAVCPHLYGIVSWNEAERSWDCPLHGSRFTPDGEVLEGPAVTGLAPSHGETPPAG